MKLRNEQIAINVHTHAHRYTECVLGMSGTIDSHVLTASNSKTLRLTNNDKSCQP